MVEKLGYAQPTARRKRFWEVELGCFGSIGLCVLLFVLAYAGFIVFCLTTGRDILPAQQ